ncbi:helix-turn-helix transcriptional regulator [Desulfobacterales bacterium HSG2]|nr:helix-turn-helix transcriptional regulator [Desulfobacterales bacterium HSG2]
MSKDFGWFKDELEKVRDSFEYKLAGIELEFTEKVLSIMDRKEITRAELARRLNVSDAAVSELFSKPSDISLKQAFGISEALSCEINISLIEKNAYIHEKTVYNPKEDVSPIRFELDRMDFPDDFDDEYLEEVYSLS